MDLTPTAVRTALGADHARVYEKVNGPLLEAFLKADVPATAYHGDANAGNFLVDDFRGKKFERLTAIDVGSMQYSIDEHGHGTKTGAGDVARFLGSLETLAPGVLFPDELERLRTRFMSAYFAEYARHDKGSIDRAAYAHAENWYRLELEFAVLPKDASAKARILQLLDKDL